MIATPKKFSMQQVFEVLLRKPSDKSIIGFLTDTKTSGLENTADMVYPTGGRGNTYIGGGYSHSKKAAMNITMATWNTEVFAMQNGTEIVTGATSITELDIIPLSGNKYITSHTAIGASGAEVGYVYAVNEDGTYDTRLEQSTAVATGKFTYSPTNREITLSTADKTSFGNKDLACAYSRLTGTGAQLIKVESDAIPPVVLVDAYGLAKDICTGELFPAVVSGRAQVDGNFSFDLSSDGEPAVHSLNLEFVKSCSSKRLYDFVIYEQDPNI